MNFQNICKVLNKHGLFYGIIPQPWLKYSEVQGWYIKDNAEIDRLTEDEVLQHMYLRVDISQDEYDEVIAEIENYSELEEIVVTHHHILEWYILII